MKITRHGKCSTCQRPCKEQREFIETVNMFDPGAKTPISGELSEQIKEWRESPLYCGDHINKLVGGK